MKYSVIDISSNSVSLIVVDRETDNGEIVFKDRTGAQPAALHGR